MNTPARRAANERYKDRNHARGYCVNGPHVTPSLLDMFCELCLEKKRAYQRKYMRMKKEKEKAEAAQ